MVPNSQSIYSFQYFLFSMTTLFLDSKIGRFLLFTFVLTVAQELEKTCSSKMICNDRFALNENLSFSVSCDEQTKEMFLINPDVYEKHLSVLNAALSEIKQDPYMRWKMELRAQHPNFSVAFCSQQTMDYTFNGLYKEGGYSAETLQLCLSPNETENFSRLRNILRHEWHHAYISARNEHHPLSKHKFFTQNNEIRGGISPCKEYDPTELAHIFQDIRNRLELYVLAFNILEARQLGLKNQKAKISTKLWINDDRYKEKFLAYCKNQTIPISLQEENDIKKLARHYEPMAKRYIFALSKVPWMFSKGILSKNNQVLKSDFPLSVSVSNIQLYANVLNIDSISVTVSARTVNSIRLKDRIKAMLLDGVFQADVCNKIYYEEGNYCDIFLKEIDAYLHEVYGAYPKIFAFLCPELKKYHESIDNQVLQPFMISRP